MHHHDPTKLLQVVDERNKGGFRPLLNALSFSVRPGTMRLSCQADNCRLVNYEAE